MKQRPDRCETCRFWSAPAEFTDEAKEALCHALIDSPLLWPQPGECHRHAPALENSQFSIIGRLWPKTYATEYCGDWEKAAALRKERS